MKRIKTVLIIMAVLTLGAVGIYFAAGHFSNKNKEKLAEEANKLVIFNFDTSDATNLKIHNESGDYELQYSLDDGWKMISDTDFEPNSFAPNNICSTLSTLTAQKIIESDDTSKFGFDDPIILTVTVNDKDYTLRVGDAAPTNESFYVMKEGSDSIYLISYRNGLVLCADKNSLKNIYIADMFTSDVESFTFWKGKETDENILFAMKKDADDKWIMTKPYTDMTVFRSNVTGYLDTITSDTLSRFIEEKCPESKYAEYGFDDPQYVFEISDGKKYQKVIFGDDTNNDTEIYGLFTNTGQVAAFEKNNIAILGYSTVDMIDCSVFKKTVEEIKGISVKTADFEANAEIDSANDSYKMDGNAVNSDDSDKFSAYFKFLDAVNEACFDEIDRKSSPSGEAEITVTYTMSDNSENVIEYIPGAADDSYWVVKNGKYDGFIVNSKVIANIISTYNDLEKAIKD